MKKSPRMTEVFRIVENDNLSNMLPSATKITPGLATQQVKDAAKVTTQSIQNAMRTPGTTLKQTKTDPQHPNAQMVITKDDGSADVVDSMTGQLKPIDGMGTGQPSKPMKTGGVFGT